MTTNSLQQLQRKNKLRKFRITIYCVSIIFLSLGIFKLRNKTPITENIDLNSSEIQQEVESEDTQTLSETEFMEAALTPVSQIDVYGEIINIDFTASGENQSLTLIATNNYQIYDSFNISEAIDDGINTSQLPVGSFYLMADDGSLLSYEQDLDINFNTITRNNKVNPIKLSTDEDLLTITKGAGVADDSELDILIDAGHGGDVGASSIDGNILETDLNLSVATYLANDLTDLGYNVELTRTDDTIPGGGCDNNYDSYCTGGRVTQAYDKNAKLVISIHHNTLGLGYEGDQSGYEVYSSVYSSHKLATEISSELVTISTPSSRVDGYISEGVYTNSYTDISNPLLEQDYMYIIRETGGIATNSTNQYNKPNNELPRGAETVLIELGYLDNDEDLAHISDEEVQQQEAKAIADGINQYLQPLDK